MQIGYDFPPHTAAKPKSTSPEDAPTQMPMRASIKPADRKNPSTDQLKVRRRLNRNMASSPHEAVNSNSLFTRASLDPGEHVHQSWNGPEDVSSLWAGLLEDSPSQAATIGVVSERRQRADDASPQSQGVWLDPRTVGSHESQTAGIVRQLPSATDGAHQGVACRSLPLDWESSRPVVSQLQCDSGIGARGSQSSTGIGGLSGAISDDLARRQMARNQKTASEGWWSTGVIGQSMLGSPGSFIIDIEPTATYLVHGPSSNIAQTPDFTVTVRFADGHVSTVGKSYDWLQKQQQDAHGAITGARSDYEHWNEDADYMWWNEEGKHQEEPPDPDDFYDAHTPDDDDEPEHDEFEASRKESSMNLDQREAAILQALGQARPDEQVALVTDLEAVRAAKREAIAADRELDFGNAYIRDVLTPVVTHQHHTAATDWIADITVEADWDTDTDHKVRAEASLWYGRVSDEVKADGEEYVEQARGMARRVAGLLGDTSGRAVQAFLDHACHLNKIASPDVGTADESGQGVSSLPVEVTVDNAPEVLPNFAPPVDPINADVAFQEPTGADAPVVQENQQETPETSSGGSAPIADASGQGVSKLPEPNDQKPAFASLVRAEKEYRCLDCGAEFDTPEEMNDHIDSNHNEGYGTKQSRRYTAAEPIADESGQAVSQLPMVEEAAPETMWALIDEEEEGQAADVASVPTPGQEVADYPQPKGASWKQAEDEAKQARSWAITEKQGTDSLPEIEREPEGWPIGGDQPTETVAWDELPTTGDANTPASPTATSAKQAGGLDNLGDAKAKPFGSKEDEDEDEQAKEARRVVAEGGSTCSVCGDPIERDPEGEANRTWHHTSGDKHDHEASPGESEKESRRLTASWYCNTHGVYVGDGNRDTHAGCKLEQRQSEETKESRRTADNKLSDEFIEQVQDRSRQNMNKLVEKDEDEERERRRREFHRAEELDAVGKRRTIEARLGREVPLTPRQAAFRARCQAALGSEQ